MNTDKHMDGTTTLSNWVLNKQVQDVADVGMEWVMSWSVLVLFIIFL